MHAHKTLLIIALFQQAIATPLAFERPLLPSSLSPRTTGFSDLALSIRQLLRLSERGKPPRECAKKDATEEDGCFTVKDNLKHSMRFALVPGQDFGSNNLGKGFWGSVAHCVTKDGTDIAVKNYKRNSPRRRYMAQKNYDLLRELEGNEYVIKAIGLGTVQGNPALAMELAPDGDLDSRIEKNEYKGKRNEENAKSVFNKLSIGLKKMHSVKIAHGDLFDKKANIVFKGNTPKFIDFDFACKDTGCVNYVPGGPNGEAAPEALTRGQKRPSYQIDPYANDVWHMGRLIIRMTTGEPLERTSTSVMRNIWNNDIKSERVELIRRKYPDFTKAFAELVADLICKQDQRIKMDKFQERFQDITIWR